MAGNSGYIDRRTLIAGMGLLSSVIPRTLYAAEKGSDRPAALGGDRFLAGGREYRLADIAAPPLYRPGKRTPDHFRQSKAALQALLDTQTPALTPEGGPDRWGVQHVAATSEDTGDWSGELVRTGAARVRPRTGNLDRIDRLLSLERLARNRQAGLWQHETYRIRNANDPDDIRDTVGGYHLLKGTVFEAKYVKRRFFLNFGSNYRTDFTATAGSRNGRKWARNGTGLETLAGKTILLRGFIRFLNGPSVELVHIRQIHFPDIPAGRT